MEEKEITEELETEAGKETEEAPEKKKSSAGRRALKIVLIVIAVLLGLVLLAVAAFFILRAIGKSHFKPAVMNVDIVGTVDNAVAYDEGKTVKYKGETYVYNEDVIYVAFMGVDKNELDSVEGVAHSAGQSDTNMIIAVDTEKGAHVVQFDNVKTARSISFKVKLTAE